MNLYHPDADPIGSVSAWLSSRLSLVSRRFLAQLLACVVLLGMAHPALALAATTCTTPVATFTQTSGSNPYTGSTGVGNVVMTGNLTLTTSCSGTTNGGIVTLIAWAVPDQTNTTEVPGLGVRATGLPTYSGTCNYNAASSGEVKSFQYWYSQEAFTTSGACQATATWPLEFIITGSTGVGNGNPLNGWNANGEPVPYYYQDFQTTPVVGIVAGNEPALNFAGVQTCTVAVPSIAVALPTVDVEALATAGASAGATPFQIQLTGCTFPSTAYVATTSFSFTQGNASNLIANSAASPASNVQLQIVDANGTPIVNGGTRTLTVTAAGNYSTFYTASYYAIGAAGAGAVNGTVNFNITFN